MNWKRGLFRFWVVATFCWLAAGLWSDWGYLKPLFELSPSVSEPARPSAQPGTSTPPGEPNRFARFAAEDAAAAPTPSPENPFLRFLNEPPARISFGQAVYPEQARKLALETLAGLLLPPFVVLLFGFGVAWTIAGFRVKAR